MSTIFKGEDRFQTIVKKAQSEDWKAIPIGKRIIKFAEELRGTPYESFTLEIDDHIESPSVNLDGVDCWTFFEANAVAVKDRLRIRKRSLKHFERICRS